MTKKLINSTALAASIFLVLSGCAKKTSPPPPAPAPAVTQAELERATIAVQKAPTFDNYTALGLAQLKARNFGGALVSFQNSTRVDPQSALGYNNTCVAYNELGKWSDAIEACKKAVKLDPKMELANNNLLHAVNSQKQAAARIAALEEKAQSSTDAELLLQLGLEYYTQGDYRRAITVWKRAPQNAKVAPMIQNNIASAAIMTKDFSLAKQAIDQALAAEPQNPLFMNNRNWLIQTQKEAGIK